MVSCSVEIFFCFSGFHLIGDGTVGCTCVWKAKVFAFLVDSDPRLTILIDRDVFRAELK